MEGGDVSAARGGDGRGTHLVVLGVLDLASATKGVHAGVDVLVEMETLLRLGDSTARRHEDGVEEVGVAVVELASDERHRPRCERTERLLLPGGDVSQDPNVLGEDVLSGTDDGDGVLLELFVALGSVGVGGGRVVVLELAEDVADLEALLEVVVLVGVDELEVLSAMEDNGVVLVVRLAVSEDGVARQLDAELGTTLAVGEDLRVTIDEGGEDPGLAAFLAGTLLVEVGDLEVGVRAEEELGVLDLLLAELGVALHRDDEAELATRHPLELALESLGVAAEELDDLGVLDAVEELDGLGVVHESGDGTVERLSAQRRPDPRPERVLGGGRLESDGVERDVVGLLVALLVQVGRFLGENLGVADKVVPLDGVELLEVLEEGDAGVLVLLADDLSEGEEDLLRVVRREDGEGGHGVDGEGLGDGRGEGLGEEGDSTCRLGSGREELDLDALQSTRQYPTPDCFSARHSPCPPER